MVMQRHTAIRMACRAPRRFPRTFERLDRDEIRGEVPARGPPALLFALPAGLTDNRSSSCDGNSIAGRYWRCCLPLQPRPIAAAAATDDWERIAREYDVTREVIQLEHGNWGMMARPVLAAYHAHVERVNRDTSYYARRTMVGDLEAARAALPARWVSRPTKSASPATPPRR